MRIYLECTSQKHIAVMRGIIIVGRVIRSYRGIKISLPLSGDLSVKRSHCSGNEEKALAVNSQKHLPAKKRSEKLLCFHDTYNYYYVYMKSISFLQRKPCPLRNYNLMTITFENGNDIIVYALKKIISFARMNQHIFIAQYLWWIAAGIGLLQGLIDFIDNLDIRTATTNTAIQEIFTMPRNIGRKVKESCLTRGDTILSAAEHFLEESIEARKDYASKRSRSTHPGRINPVLQTNQQLKQAKKQKGVVQNYSTQTEGTEASELRRRKAADQCERCAWPQDLKGGHDTLDCYWWTHLNKGTAPISKSKK